MWSYICKFKERLQDNMTSQASMERHNSKDTQREKELQEFLLLLFISYKKLLGMSI